MTTESTTLQLILPHHIIYITASLNLALTVRPGTRTPADDDDVIRSGSFSYGHRTRRAHRSASRVLVVLLDGDLKVLCCSSMGLHRRGHTSWMLLVMAGDTDCAECLMSSDE